MIGIRTPWTLSSDQVWERTHRLGRLPVMLAGFAILFAAITAQTAILLKLTVAGVLVVAAGLLLSYLLWRGGNDAKIAARANHATPPEVMPCRSPTPSRR